MLITFVVVYLLVTIAIGLIAARRVHGAKDFLVAGRSLPLYMNVATVFATWFGAETVLSVSSTFAKDGLNGIPGDPFGASVCLVIAALLFARLFYRMNLLTIGDFYKHRYGKGVEVLTSLAITASYLGWTSAQMTALGLVIHVLSGGAVARVTSSRLKELVITDSIEPSDEDLLALSRALIADPEREGVRRARFRPYTENGTPAAGYTAAQVCALTNRFQITKVPDNAAVGPEKSKSFTLGFAVEPAQGLSASVDYWQTQIDDVIGNRAYGTEPAKVAAIARAVTDGLEQGGVLPWWQQGSSVT